MSIPALATFLIYAPSLGFGMAYDDSEAVVGALRSIQGHSFVDLLTGARILKVLSFAIDEWLFGQATWGYHFHSVIWAALGAGLVGQLAYGIDRRRRSGILAGLLFAAHPVHVEAVANLANRKDAMATALALGAILALLPIVRAGRMTNVWRACAGIALLMLSFMTKEVVAAGAAGLILALMFLPSMVSGRDLRAMLVPKRVVMVIVLGGGTAVASMVLMQRFIQGGFGRLYESERLLWYSGGTVSTAGDWILRAGSGLGRSLALMVFPVGLSVDHPVPPGGLWGTVVAVPAIVVLLGLFVAAFRLREPLVAVGCVWLLPTLLPVLNLLPLSYFFVAERYLYLPSVGLVLLVVGLLRAMESRRIPQKRRGGWKVTVTAMVLVMLGTAATMSREAVWEDDLTLWTNTVKDQPESYRARVNLGKEYMLAGRYDAAEVQIKTALKLTRSLPDRADMECLLGSAHLVQGAYEPAVTALRRGLELRPGDGDCRSALAMALMKLGRGQSALREAKQAAMGNGRVSLENLIRVYDHLARPCDAASVCAKLRQLYPDQMAGGVSVYCRSAEPSCE